MRQAAAPRAALVSGAALLLLYLATLAPDVTLWDAGEFAAAAAVYGVPHPPGTPLYVTVARAWSLFLAPLPVVVATNLFSAVSTAAAFALLGALVARWLGAARWGIAAAICAGSFSTAWRSAVETEVYGPALLLAVLALWAAERAGTADVEGRRLRWSALAAYALALAVPLHLTTLLAAPAALLLAWRGDRARWAEAAVVGGGAALAAGVALPSMAAGALGVAALLAGGWRLAAPGPLRRAGAAAALPLLCVLALSAVLVLPLRARHDPPLNQGNPATLEAARDVVLRRQYQVAPLWPRQAPAWLQFANLFEWGDWQVALGLAPGPVPTVPRVAVSLAFVALGFLGAAAHRRRDRVGWGAVLLLLLAGGPGAAAQLNLKAGPSFGHGVLPDGAEREARERDYFFVLAFTGWGLWAGMGAMALAERARNPLGRGAAFALPLVPAVLNAPAVNARAMPDAALARDVAEALLASVPPGGVLLTAGDNDTYPLWYLQMAEGRRPDVLVLPVPLLPAPWFREELARRDGLQSGGPYAGEEERLALVARSARRAGRPLAASPGLQRWPPPGADPALPESWSPEGDSGPAGGSWRGVVRVLGRAGEHPRLAPAVAAELERRLARQATAPDAAASLRGERRAPRVDPAPGAVRKSLLCAGLLGGAWRPSGTAGLLAPGCAVR